MFLHHAIYKGFPGIVECLINNTNIDVNVKNGPGESAVEYAIMFSRAKIVKLLLETDKVDYNSINNNGNTLLHIAVTYCINEEGKEIIEYLLNNTMIVANAKNNKNQTALDLANNYGNNEIVAIIENKQNELIEQNNIIITNKVENNLTDSLLIGVESHIESTSY